MISQILKCLNLLAAVLLSVEVKCSGAVGYGELDDVAANAAIAKCYDGFLKSLKANTDRCGKMPVLARCDAINPATYSRLRLDCDVFALNKAAEYHSEQELSMRMLDACDDRSEKSQKSGYNKHIVLEMYDRICQVGLGDAIGKSLEPAMFQHQFAAEATLQKLQDVYGNDKAPLLLSAKIAKDVEARFRDRGCMNKGVNIFGCDKQWPHAGMFGIWGIGGVKPCLIVVDELISMNEKHIPPTGKGAETGKDKTKPPRRAKQIWNARQILCGPALEGNFDEKATTTADKSKKPTKSQFEIAMEKAVAAVKL